MTIRLPASPARPLLTRLIRSALNAADAGEAVRHAVTRKGHMLSVGRRRYDLRRYDHIDVVGAGKATASMARAVERILGARLRRGLVVVKKGHVVPTRRIVVKQAGHPVPDAAGLAAARRMRTMTSELTARDLLIVLLSGGASSLMPAPPPGISLRDKQRVTDQLLRSGAGIREINCVRKHLSELKGGRLAASTSASIITLILSDVLGDDISAIASGPTAPDPTTFREAVRCLKRYGLWSRVPSAVRARLSNGCTGLVPETPKPGSPLFRRVQHLIVGNNRRARLATEAAARKAGVTPFLSKKTLTGDASRTGRRFASLARELARDGTDRTRPACVIAGGETTVTVKGTGRGGRAQEFAAAAALAVAGMKQVWVAAVGTDGTDGPTEVAGAVIDGGTASRARRVGIDLREALAANNTYPALKKLGAHIATGPTNTNVNDLYLLLLL